jgi:hypothetical protein
MTVVYKCSDKVVTFDDLVLKDVVKAERLRKDYK